jgi:hypothetical protein
MFSSFTQRSAPSYSGRQQHQRPSHAPVQQQRVITPATQASPSASGPAAWAAIEHARFYFVDLRRTPVPLPARLLKGFFSTAKGDPCRRIVVDGFGVSANVVPDRLTGKPRVIWVDNGHPEQFKVIA